jgi:hypothetical protein
MATRVLICQKYFLRKMRFDLPNLRKFCLSLANVAQVAITCKILSNGYSHANLPKVFFEKNKIQLATFAQVLLESGKFAQVAITCRRHKLKELLK